MVTPATASTGLLTTAQVARRFGVVRMTVVRAARCGRLAYAIKLPGANGAYLFTEDAVVAWRSCLTLEGMDL